MMQIEFTVVFSVATACLSLYATYSKMRADFKKDEETRRKDYTREKEEQTKRHIEIKTALEYIAKDVEETKGAWKVTIKDLDEIDKRLSILEKSVQVNSEQIVKIEDICRVGYRQ